MLFSDKYRFADWPNDNVPSISAGVYGIWHEDKLFYCGMSGRQLEKAMASGKKRFGRVTGLNSHASGRLSGDQFCVYVANRLVVPSLTPEQLPKFAAGELKLGQLTKTFIHDHLDYQYVLADSSAEAFAIEAALGGVKSLGRSPC
jgi:hypothetical protein